MNKNWLLLTVASAILVGACLPTFAQNPIPPPPRAPAPRNPTTLPSNSTADVSAPAAAPVSTSVSSATASAGSDYVLSPADAVEMTVFHQADLSTQTKIANDGTVQFPLIGELKIGGLTLRDARELIRKRYNADYLVEPQVNLNVLAYAPRKFTILGQVTTPGTYVMPGGEHLGLMEAIGMAGGFTRIADRNAVTITRAGHKGEKPIKVNTKKDGEKFELLAGDVINVGETWL